MSILPNPFDDFADPTPRSADPAAASSLPVPQGDAAAEPFPRGFDPARFLADIEMPPAFLSAPRPEYLAAAGH